MLKVPLGGTIAALLTFGLPPFQSVHAQEQGEIPLKGTLKELKLEEKDFQYVIVDECEVPFVCVDEGDVVDSGSLVVSGAETETCPECYELTGCSSTSGDCYYGDQICCLEDPAIGACADEGLVPLCTQSLRRKLIPYEYHLQDGTIYPFSVVDGDPTHLFEFTGVGLGTAKPFRASSRYRAQAWTLFQKIAAQHKGLTPGTMRLRAVNYYRYRSYVRIRSQHDGTLYDQQVEGKANNVAFSIGLAYDAAHELVEHLQAIGHQSIAVLPGLKVIKEVNLSSTACREPVSCRRQCTTNTDLVIQVARFGRTRNSACIAAAAAAEAIADQYGGIRPFTCRNLPASKNPDSQVSEAGCADCSQAPVAAEENQDAAQSASTTDAESTTDAANP